MLYTGNNNGGLFLSQTQFRWNPPKSTLTLMNDTLPFGHQGRPSAAGSSTAPAQCRVVDHIT
jgi:hypothetical protein